jgi:hypothetical protein
VWWDDTPTKVKDVYKGLTKQERDILLSDDSIELVSERSYPDPQAHELLAAALAHQPAMPQLPGPGGPRSFRFRRPRMGASCQPRNAGSGRRRTADAARTRSAPAGWA